MAIRFYMDVHIPAGITGALLLQIGNASESQIPTSFQLARHKPVLGIDLIVRTLRRGGLRSGPFPERVRSTCVSLAAQPPHCRSHPRPHEYPPVGWPREAAPGPRATGWRQLAPGVLAPTVCWCWRSRSALPVNSVRLAVAACLEPSGLRHFPLRKGIRYPHVPLFKPWKPAQPAKL